MTAAPVSSEFATPTSGGGRPQVYKTKDGKRVPGVTTVTSRFKDSGGLIHWAYECGVQGIDYRRARDDAADAGHVAHEMIDAEIHGRFPDFKDVPEDLVDLAAKGFSAFCSWRDQVKLEIVDTERPLVSDLHRFGGTYDALARINGAIALLDWKSGNGLYVEHVIQCAAYRQLLREHGTPVDDAYILRVGKEFADFHFHAFPSAVLDLAWDAFERMRALYDLDSKLKKVVR